MKKSLLSIVATIALAGMANAGSVVFDNFSGTFSQIQARDVAIPAGTGFIAVGTTALTPNDLAGALVNGELSIAGRDALAASFVQFGAGVQFGFAGNDGYFQGNAQGDGGAAAFENNPVILVAGNGASILESTSLLIIAGADNFAADGPVFSTNVGPDAGQVIFGAAGGTNSIAANFGAIQMGNVVPEPGVSILALLSAGIIFLRRRR